MIGNEARLQQNTVPDDSCHVKISKRTMFRFLQLLSACDNLSVCTPLSAGCLGVFKEQEYEAVRAGVAQLVEHLICNQRVGGSSPFASSRIPKPLEGSKFDWREPSAVIPPDSVLLKPE